MRFVENVPLLGRKDKPMMYGLAGQQVHLTPRLIVTEVLQGPAPRDKNTMAHQRRANKILDGVEEQADGEFLEMGDEDWTFVRELMEPAVLGLFNHHAPFIMDQLDALVNRGKPSVVDEAEQVVREMPATATVAE